MRYYGGGSKEAPKASDFGFLSALGFRPSDLPHDIRFRIQRKRPSASDSYIQDLAAMPF